MSTTHIGLGATVSTSFGEPYHVARTFASIDHLSRGRAAWNVVTSSAGRAALNFSRDVAATAAARAHRHDGGGMGEKGRRAREVQAYRRTTSSGMRS